MEDLVKDYEQDVLVGKALQMMYAIHSTSVDELGKPYFLKVISFFSMIASKTTNKDIWIISLISEFDKNELYSLEDLSIFGEEIKVAVSELKNSETKNEMVITFNGVKNELE